MSILRNHFFNTHRCGTRNSLFTLALVAVFCVVPLVTLATTEDELRDQISEKNREITELESKVREYQKNLEKISGTTQSLQKEVATVNATLEQLNSAIKLTETKIAKTELTIQQNKKDLARLSNEIGTNRTALGELIQSVYENDKISFFEFIVSGATVSEFFDEFDKIEQVQTDIRTSIKKKQVASKLIEEKQVALARDIENLTAYRNQAADQRRIAEQTKKEKDDLLRKTHNEETMYRAYVADLNKKKQDLDAELRAYESRLSFIMDPKNLPQTGSSALIWPINPIYITQRFGKTVDSRRLYASGSHSGVDFGAAVGTPITAMADGVVEGVGDTDQTCYRTSFGKFIFIRFTNGLAATYAHLSLQKVSEGQRVRKGDIIGYSGNTGHSTGPHLHLSVYASKSADGSNAVSMQQRVSTGACAGRVYRMPIAPINAYLDPLAYLPPATPAMFKPGAY